MSSEWEKYSIGSLVDVTQGLAINAKTKHLFRDAGLPLLRITDLISDSYSQFISEADVPKKCIASEDEIIYTRTGQVGLVFTGKRGVVHNNCFKVTPKDSRVSRKFLYWYLRQKSVYEYVNKVSAGSVQKDLNHSAFKTLMINVPPIKDQEEINALLQPMDDRITLLRETNATLEAIAQALFKSWFVDFDPVRAKAEGRQPEGMDAATAALFPDSFEETELGLVPRGWGISRIDSIAKIRDGKPWKKNDRLESGFVRVYGANGHVGWSSSALGNGRVILIGKIGSCGAINEFCGSWWATNNCFSVSCNDNEFLEYLRFVFRSIDFSGYIGGSSNPYMPLKNFSHHLVLRSR